MNKLAEMVQAQLLDAIEHAQARLQGHGVEFVIEPHTRFPGQPGDQQAGTEGAEHRPTLCGDNRAPAISTTRAMPTTLVAMQGEEAIGSVSLVDEDAPEFRGVGDAWLASLFVKPASRGQGIGAALVRACVALAAIERVPRLWLFTPEHADFYARLGWRDQGSATLRGQSVHLMDIVPA